MYARHEKRLDRQPEVWCSHEVFVRVSRVTRNGKVYEYAQLVESYRRQPDGMPQHRVVANLGRLSSLELENLRTTLAASRKGRQVVVAPSRRRATPAPKPEANLRYLDVAVAMELWREWGLDELLAGLLPQGASAIGAANVIEILTIQRLIAPDSKLAATRWFSRTALPELLGIRPKQLNNTRIHRVLEQLEAVTPSLMAMLPSLCQERGGAFVSLFMDVTDAWFVGRGPELAVRAKTKEGLVERKIGIVLLCNERGYPLRWEVIAGNRNDSVVMGEMLKGISGLRWAAEAPLVLDRAMGTTAHIRMMSGHALRFLTALTRTEFSTYASQIPWSVTQELTVTNRDLDEASQEAGQRVETAGMHKVDDTLFVLDLGVLEPMGADPQPQTAPLSMDRNAMAMHLARQTDLAVASGKYSSHAAAATAHGVHKDLVYKYRKLLGLAEQLQRQVLAGEAEDYTLASLIRVARLDDSRAQQAAFDALVRSSSHRRATAAKSAPVAATQDATASAPLRVRVVAYFNPERFVRNRLAAIERLRRITAFTVELNRKLANPRSHRKRGKLLAQIEQRLRRDHLVGAFKIFIDEQVLNGHRCFEVRIELDNDEWRRRRRYDGFSVLVAHPQLPHSATELCKLYRAKDMVEKDFQVIKSVLELRPIRHRTDPKVSAHVTLCMLALLLERTLRDKLGARHTVGQALELLEPCRLNRYRGEDDLPVYTTTELHKEQRSVLAKLGLQHLADDALLADRIHTP